MAEYHFRTLVPADKALFCAWLAEPHIAGWWQDGATEWALIEEDWSHETTRTDMRIARIDGTDFAYVQSYEAHAYGMPHYADRPNGAQAMDSFLGDPAYLAQGHGAGFVRARALELIGAGAPVVLVDPDVLNTHAIGSYTRAGFIPVEERPCEDGDPVLVMEFTG
ncbi:GNAT family N-acetyltransferase [Algirhabdus cladophorae]|uniref:GNAT family N-acetyltransferase n=1 Tax=Algirhabdus cladophorae TaxID=3377108 RepID=UPI003B849F23